MTQQIFTKDNITLEALFQIFDNAFMNPTLNEDVSVVLHERFRTTLRLSETKDRLMVYTLFTGNTEIDELEKYKLVNKINSSFYVAKVMIDEDDGCIRFDYDLDLKGDVSAKAIVYNIKSFQKTVELVIDNGAFDTIFG